MINSELTYWIALAHTPKMWTSRKNELIAYFHKLQKTITDFFASPDYLQAPLTSAETDLLNATRTELPNYAFLAEELINQGYDIIPITSPDYSSMLKSNLKYSAPIVLYTKGNKALLHERSIAVVGSRNANEHSMQFTDRVARGAVESSKVVVSGYARGIDRQALDSTLAYNGRSIIVLPQGITTFASGMKTNYKHIVAGSVLVVSTFHPKLPWAVELAMARNSIIYGLASEIYVAQSDDKGGTWSGATEGLKKGRPIFVRIPEARERCANLKLIEMGATAVDSEGQRIVSNPITPNQQLNFIEYLADI